MAIISGGLIIEGAQRRVGDPTAEHSSADSYSAGGMRVARVRSSFAADGGAVSTIALAGSTIIPANAVILGGFVDVVTVPTSGGAATIAIQAEAANDVVLAALISGAPWSSVGRKSVIPVFTGASSLRTTVARDVSAVIGVAALTAGVFDVYLIYAVVA